MPSVETYHKYIDLNPQGVPVIKGTRFKVIILVEEKLAWGWDAKEMYRQHPSLSPEQIQAAMNYYANHREEIDLEISSSLKAFEKIRREAGTSELRKKLKAKGL
ncbi:DUF433 domain-containing protein [Candidatus Poribacteria bacterium]|nr:DUF433 domain-containing protein [Candidatus Poribacteria bacterium]